MTDESKYRTARTAVYAAAQACEAAGLTFSTDNLATVRRGSPVLPELLAILDKRVERCNPIAVGDDVNVVDGSYSGHSERITRVSEWYIYTECSGYDGRMYDFFDGRLIGSDSIERINDDDLFRIKRDLDARRA